MSLTSFKPLNYTFDPKKRQLVLHVELIEGTPQQGQLLFLPESNDLLAPSLQQVTPLDQPGRYQLTIQWQGKVIGRPLEKCLKNPDTVLLCGFSPEDYLALPLAEKITYLSSVADRMGSPRVAEYLKKDMQPACKLVLFEDQPPSGLSRFGGLPLARPGFEFPVDKNGQSRLFVGQLRINELKEKSEVAARFEKDGMLYFFMDVSDAEDFEAEPEIAVIYSEHVDRLEEIVLPDDLKEYGMFAPCAVEIRDEITLSSLMGDLLNFKYPESEALEFIDVVVSTTYQTEGLQLFGHPVFVQDSVAQEAEMKRRKIGESQKITQTLQAELEAAASHWEMLLSINMMDSPYFHQLSNYDGEFGNPEVSFFLMIHKDDLAKMDFKRTESIYQFT